MPSTPPGHADPEPRVTEAAPWNKGRRLPPEPLTHTEVLALLRACSSKAPTGQRNAALIVLLWRAGLRCSEALDLYAKDIDAQAHTVSSDA